MQIPITRWLLYKFVKGTAQGAAELTCQNIVPETFDEFLGYLEILK